MYVDALARAGRLNEAVLTFEKMQTYGNQCGNFPHAFTHLPLINAAITLNSEMNRRAQRAKPTLIVA